MTEPKVFIVDYSLHDNAVEELKKDSIKNNPDNQSKDADDSIFTGIDFFNKTGFVLSGYLDDYFKNYVSRDPDSIINEVQYMLTVAKTGKEIYPFLLFKFTNKYISPAISSLTLSIK